MDKISLKGVEYILVPHVEENCYGCAFFHDPDIEYGDCMDVGRGDSVCVHGDDESGNPVPPKDPRILIKNTPEAIAEYTIRRMGGDTDDE